MFRLLLMKHIYPLYIDIWFVLIWNNQQSMSFKKINSVLAATQTICSWTKMRVQPMHRGSGVTKPIWMLSILNCFQCFLQTMNKLQSSHPFLQILILMRIQLNDTIYQRILEQLALVWYIRYEEKNLVFTCELTYIQLYHYTLSTYNCITMIDLHTIVSLCLIYIQLYHCDWFTYNCITILDLETSDLLYQIYIWWLQTCGLYNLGATYSMSVIL